MSVIASMGLLANLDLRLSDYGVFGLTVMAACKNRGGKIALSTAELMKSSL